MRSTKTFSVRARGRSFKYAFEGLINFFNSEHNALLHLIASIAVLSLAFILHVSRSEAIALVIVAGFVWSAELFNTAIEKIMDFISKEEWQQIKYIKDLSAAAVLVAAFIALVTALIVFIPKL